MSVQGATPLHHSKGCTKISPLQCAAPRYTTIELFFSSNKLFYTLFQNECLENFRYSVMCLIRYNGIHDPGSAGCWMSQILYGKFICLGHICYVTRNYLTRKKKRIQRNENKSYFCTFNRKIDNIPGVSLYVLHFNTSVTTKTVF